MAKAPEGRLSRIIQDGSHLQIPGLTAGIYADREVFILSSGLLDLVNAVANQGAWMAPAPATLLAVRVRNFAQLGTADAHLYLGKQGDPDYFMDLTVPFADAAGTFYTGTLLQTAIAKDDVVYWSGDGGATSTGSVVGFAVIALN